MITWVKQLTFGKCLLFRFASWKSLSVECNFGQNLPSVSQCMGTDVPFDIEMTIFWLLVAELMPYNVRCHAEVSARSDSFTFGGLLCECPLFKEN